MDFWDLIHQRASIRSYDPQRPVEEDVLYRILEAGRLAPSAGNRQPWRFVVVSSPEKLSILRHAYVRDWFYDAPHILVVVGDRNEAWRRLQDGYCSLETDLAIAMTFLILAAANEGVATCWIAAFQPEVVREVLGLEAHEEVYGLTPLGYPKSGYPNPGPKKRKDLKDIVRFL
ncbi:nitroreductase family protein [Thermospira aquatica]|uniref:Nitroreductase family protein n=1 Tax=Thermospira aquatica TaxID=2828656 RepID=A0AAX3BDA6_9SPIR|nr:nitroreductase family protein [Thermospira aquatica]URA10098.1 nitroreductase family protein [Thermospira aquatica]